RVLAIVVGGRVVGGRAVVIAGGVVVADARVVARGRVVVARGGRVGGLGRRDGLGLVLDGRRRHEGGALTAATLALAGERGTRQREHSGHGEGEDDAIGHVQHGPWIGAATVRAHISGPSFDFCTVLRPRSRVT